MIGRGFPIQQPTAQQVINERQKGKADLKDFVAHNDKSFEIKKLITTQNEVEIDNELGEVGAVKERGFAVETKLNLGIEEP